MKTLRRALLRSALALALASGVFFAAACAPTESTRFGPKQELGMATNKRTDIVIAHGGLEFDAVIDAPGTGASNGWGVLLIGGGVGNDLDWTTPGSVTVDGQAMALTISGTAHADAPALAKSLVQHGFTVIRWSTIARGDPLAGQWPLRATPRTIAELTAQARAAITALRARHGIDPDEIVLIGHSLGAARACRLALDDGGVRGLVLLAPAYVTTKSPLPASIPGGECPPLSEVLAARPIPTLSVFGTRDTSRPVDAEGVAALATTRGDRLLEVRRFDGLGHQLGLVEGSLIGPIDDAVTRAVAEWAAALAHDTR